MNGEFVRYLHLLRAYISDAENMLSHDFPKSARQCTDNALATVEVNDDCRNAADEVVESCRLLGEVCKGLNPDESNESKIASEKRVALDATWKLLKLLQQRPPKTAS